MKAAVIQNVAATHALLLKMSVNRARTSALSVHSGFDVQTAKKQQPSPIRKRKKPNKMVQQLYHHQHEPLYSQHLNQTLPRVDLLRPVYSGTSKRCEDRMSVVQVRVCQFTGFLALSLFRSALECSRLQLRHGQQLSLNTS